MEKFIKKNGKDITETELQDNKNEPTPTVAVLSGPSSSSDISPIPNKRQKISFVWKHFKRSRDHKFAKCVYCDKEYKTSGNTTNLQDHLKRFHSTELTPNNNQSFTSNFSSSSSTLRSSMTGSINTFFKRSAEYESTSQRKQDLDKTLALMIAIDMQPFNIVNDTGFQKFVNLLDPRYIIPSKFTIRENIIKHLYLDCCNKLKAILNVVRYVAVTMDLWTSVANDSYLTVTCHFINPDTYKLNTATLGTKLLRDNHTSQKIADSLQTIFQEWSIEEKVSCIVSDNAANMIKTCEILKKKHLPCFAHSLNLAVQDNLKLECLHNISKRCKEIVTFVKQSNVASDMFKSFQIKDFETNSRSDTENKTPMTPYKLIQEVPTRWNSFLYMIVRILETSSAINQTLLKMSKAPSPLTNDELTILKDLKEILSCISEASDKIQGMNYVTVSLIIPMTFGIYNGLLKTSSTLITDEGKLFCNGLIESVKKRLFSYETRSVTRISTILDPRFKKEGFRNQENATQGSIFLEQEMNSIMRAVIDKGNLGNDLPQNTERVTTSKLFSFMEERINEKSRSVAADAIIRRRQYLERPNASEQTDPLIFWQVNGNDLHPLPLLCLKYLCIPGSSAESERNFSTAGQIISDRRSRLKPENVDILIFIRKNFWLLDK